MLYLHEKRLNTARIEGSVFCAEEEQVTQNLCATSKAILGGHPHVTNWTNFQTLPSLLRIQGIDASARV